MSYLRIMSCLRLAQKMVDNTDFRIDYGHLYFVRALASGRAGNIIELRISRCLGFVLFRFMVMLVGVYLEMGRRFSHSFGEMVFCSRPYPIVRTNLHPFGHLMYLPINMCTYS